jgi:PAS domain S-box-containing protein
MENRATILIVDDQLGAREILRGLLKGQPYELILAENGPEALAKAAEFAPDLILLDVMMPGMDGFEVCQRLRADAYLAEIPIIMITALDDRDSRLRGLETGVDDFISKPFDAVELKARVQTVTRLNRYRRLLLERTYRQQAEEEVYRRNQELTVLNRVITGAASTLEVDEILYLACEAMAHALYLPQATAMLLNEDQTQFVTSVEYHDSAAKLNLGRPASPHRPGQLQGSSDASFLVGLISERLATYKTPLVFSSLELTDPGLAEVYHLMRESGLGLLVVIPILMGDHLAGVIELNGLEPRAFDGHDLGLMQSVGAAIGQALETAFLYQDLQAHASSLEETVAQRTRDLQRERDRTKAILDALGEAVVVTDLSGQIRYVNPAGLALTGYAEAELTGQDWRIWQSRKTRDGEGADEALYQDILAAVNAGRKWQGEVNNKRQDGRLYDALLTVAPLFDPKVSDQPVGFVSIQSDITPLKEAERLRVLHQEREKQAALDRLRHTFLSTVNHEMRTPLALIFQSIEMLEDSQLGEMTDGQLDAVMALRRQAWNLGQMVENLTRVAAFLSKRETVRPVLAQLDPVFNSLLPLAEFKARTKQILVEADIAPDLPAFLLDVKQIEEALIQLVDNAIKFNQAGGKIKISAWAEAEWVMLAVSDTGKGIEAEQLNRIWEVFEQGSDPLRRAQEGLGLGLVLARYIVEAHRGVIEVETVLGQGSTFTIKLPRVKAKAGAE